MPFEANSTNELVEDTCNLHQLVPINSSSLINDVCPAVSTASQCVHTTMKSHFEFTSLGLSDFQHVIHIGSKSGSVDVDIKNGVNSINISILLILMAMFFVRLN